MYNQNYNIFWQRIHKSAKEKGFPLRVMLELTYRCNFYCWHCYVPHVYRKKIERREEELLALLDFSRSSGTELSLENAIRVILDVLRKLFRYQTCIIFETISVGEESYFVTFRH